MTWKLVLKDKKTQPAGTDYTAWKEQIAKECFFQCVYCAINEAAWGGINNYHIDHYKPKSKFKALELDICNLFYSCPVCNRFKSDDWPANPSANLDNISYPDPSQVDYSTLFAMDQDNYSITGNKVASQYVVERLYLNRPQLIYERRERKLMETESQLRKEVMTLALQSGDTGLMAEALTIANRLLTLLHKRGEVRPYKQLEIKKN